MNQNLQNCLQSNRSKSLTNTYQLEKIKKFTSYYTYLEMLTIISKIDVEKYSTNQCGHRTFKKEYNKLFYSINEYINSIKLTLIRLTIFQKIELIKKRISMSTCLCGKSVKWDYSKKTFQKICKCCTSIIGGPNSLSRQIALHGKVEGFKKYKEFCKKNGECKQGQLSLAWFVTKYKYNGQYEYDKYWRFNFSKRKSIKYSKVSQQLFNEIKKLTKLDHKYLMFAEHKGEMRINFNKEDKNLIGLERVCMYVDFRYKRKIIEFDGDYWHKKTKKADNFRDIILRSKGYDILRIKECDYKLNKQKEVQKCIQFLKN